MPGVDLAQLAPIDELAGDSAEDTLRLTELATSATAYLRSFAWCRQIRRGFFGMGVGGIVGVFLFEIDPVADEDSWLWVICGDLPSAYLVVDDAPTPASALERYCEMMEAWIEAARSGVGLDEVFPIGVEGSSDNASALETRIAFLRREVIPEPVGRPDGPRK